MSTIPGNKAPNSQGSETSLQPEGMRHITRRPKFKVGDRVTVRDYETFGDKRCDFTLTITEVTSFDCTDGEKLYRYYGDSRRGPAGVYEDQIEGLA